MNTSKNYEVKKISKGKKKSKGISNSQENLKPKEIPSKKSGRPKKVTTKEIFGTTQNTDPNVIVNTPKKKSPIKSKESSKKRGRPKKAKNIEELNQNDIFVLTEESPKKTKKKCFHEEIETKENQIEEEFSNQEVEEFFKRIFSQNEQENIGIQFKNELSSQIEILNSIQQLLFEEEYIDEDLNNLNESIKFF